ncbi:isochorismatase family protein [Litchfieldella xinjiangensis]|uniref:isochorismatase family protein n=1 Tax=Litchfieldella xinjiangensis TaxID=1166948 RepID=UPI0005BE7F60|nr:isochorismatase family protein [Halomonas xinjiangensis]
MRISRDQSLMVIVDLQAKLLPVIDGGEQAVAEATWLGSLALELNVPVWFTEQYPEGLGASDPRLLERLPTARRWEKHHFGAHDETDFARTLVETGCRQVIVCGTEAHVCVLQTALGLLEAGYSVYWLVEACASRRPEEARLAKERAVSAGAVAVSADMVAYEWLQRCDTDTFRQVHRGYLKPRSGRNLRF